MTKEKGKLSASADVTYVGNHKAPTKMRLSDIKEVTRYGVNMQIAIYLYVTKNWNLKRQYIWSTVSKHELLRDGRNECVRGVSTGDHNTLLTVETMEA